METLITAAQNYGVTFLIIDASRKRSQQAIASNAPLSLDDLKGASVKVSKAHVLLCVEPDSVFWTVSASWQIVTSLCMLSAL